MGGGSVFLDDLRSGWRQIVAGGPAALLAIVMLAVAVAAVTATFSFVHGILLRPLPVADPDRVVVLWDTHERHGSGGCSSGSRRCRRSSRRRRS